MARPLRIAYPHAFYHATCRGNERKDIYRDDQDRRLFLEKLQTSLEIYGVLLHAYVLMQNHFHLIVETPKANLSAFMRHLNIAYTGAFNRRHQRVGHLYQGRFKAIVVDADSYLLALSRYVHLNPVRVTPLSARGWQVQRDYLRRYAWSSLGDYAGWRRGPDWLVQEKILSYAGGSRKRYATYIEAGLRQGIPTPWEEGLTAQVLLGEPEFVEKVKRRWRPQAETPREQPALRSLRQAAVPKVLQVVSRYFHIAPEALQTRRTRYRDERACLMECLYRYSGLTQHAIGQLIGPLDYTAVSRERKRLREQAEPKLRRWAREIETALISQVKI